MKFFDLRSLSLRMNQKTDKVETEDKKDCIYFYNHPSRRVSASHNFLNGHFYCKFRDEKGVLYRSCSDFYYTTKLRTMGDNAAADKIHATISGEKARLLAKELKKPHGMTERAKTWKDKKVDTMRKAIALKFGQNAELMQRLLLTGDKILIEDDPKNKFWYDIFSKIGEEHCQNQRIQWVTC